MEGIAALLGYLACLALALFAVSLVVTGALFLGDMLGLGVGVSFFAFLIACSVGGWVWDRVKAQRNHNP